MNISTKISAALAVAALSAAFMGYSSNANAANLRDTCMAKTRTAVDSCCHTWIRSHGTPLWMQGGNCSSASVSACRGGGGLTLKAARVAPMLCYNQTVTLLDETHDHTPPSRGGRGQAN